MKAEEPGDRVRLVKFGMAEEYQDKILERHAIVTADQRAIANFWFAHALAQAPMLLAAFERIGGRAPEPHSPPEAFKELPTEQPPDLRSALGLS